MGAIFWLNRFKVFKDKTKWIVRNGNTIFLFLIMPLAFFSLSYALLHIMLVLGVTPALLKSPSALIFAPDALDERMYTALLTDMIAVSAFLFAAFAALQQSIGRKRLEDEVLELHGFRVHEVKRKGNDDLRTMLKYFRNARKLTIFGGKFDWIEENSELKDLILRLAGDDGLELISYRTREAVEDKFASDDNTSLYEQLEDKFSFDSGLPEFKFTLIERQANEVEFLFMSPSNSTHPFNASVLASQPDSVQLLQILKALIETRQWGVK